MTKVINNSAPLTRDHHYVPRFLLRPWTRAGILWGYYKGVPRADLRVRKLGVGAFCKQLDLLSLKASGLRPDALEREFFGAVDDAGAKARDALLRGETLADADQRSDFGRLLLSLDARRPPVVAKLRNEGAAALRSSVDLDEEVIEAMREHGVTQAPSAYFEEKTGQSLDDRALLMMQKLVDNPEVGRRLINAQWRVYRLGSGDGSFLLGDRPLIRTAGYSRDDCVWALPLSPEAVFVAANTEAVAAKLDQATGCELRERINESTMNQLGRYVFMADESNLPFVRERLAK
ncbi:MAG: DUF4238 domain-containing protein [Hyphomicrobiales bacterium]|nr:MAG: DUF4238 domain-containing protein [Hyphomicrobiales bacterium]